MLMPVIIGSNKTMVSVATMRQAASSKQESLACKHGMTSHP